MTEVYLLIKVCSCYSPIHAIPFSRKFTHQTNKLLVPYLYIIKQTWVDITKWQHVNLRIIFRYRQKLTIFLLIVMTLSVGGVCKPPPHSVKKFNRKKHYDNSYMHVK